MSNKPNKRSGLARLTPENVGAGDFWRLRRQTKRESEGHAKDKMNAIACCYAIACAFDSDEAQRTKLVSDSFFEDMKHKPKEDDLSHWVLLYNFRAKKKGPARDRATRYAAILRRYRHAGIAPTQALAELERDGGITNAYRKCPKKRKPPNPVDDERSILEIECSVTQLSAILALYRSRLTVKIIPDPKPRDGEWKIVGLLAFEDQSS